MVTPSRTQIVGGYNRVATWIGDHRSKVLGGTVAIFLGLATLLVVWAILFPAPNVSPDYHPFQSKEEYEAFMQAHPLMNLVAPEGASFEIHGQVTEDRRAEYTVELFAPSLKPDNPESMKNFLAALKKSQQEALAWIKTTGEPSEGLYIAWTPNPDVLGATPTRHPMPKKNAVTTPTPTPKAGPSPAFPH